MNGTSLDLAFLTRKVSHKIVVSLYSLSIWDLRRFTTDRPQVVPPRRKLHDNSFNENAIIFHASSFLCVIFSLRIIGV